MSDIFSSAQLPVLVIEDSEIDFDTVVEATQRAKIQNRIVHADTADAARKYFTDAPQAFAFVLLDQNLPGTSGCDFLSELRGNPTYRSLPIVLYTTSSNPRDRDACYNAGANAYHIKSVRYDECLTLLCDVFQYWLKQVVLPTSNPVKA